jgi:hypothetical protein
MAARRIQAADLAIGGHWAATPGGALPYFTKAELVAAQREAEEMDYAMRLTPEALRRLPDGARFPVTQAVPHERGAVVGQGGEIVAPADEYGRQIRCRVILGPQGGAAVLDITPRRFDRLPWSD